MKRKILMTIGILAATSMVVAAQQRGRGGRSGPRPVDVEKIRAELGIDAAQVESLQKIHSEQRKAGVRHRADTQIAHMDLEELLGADTVDEKAVNAKVQALAQLHEQMLQDRVDARVAVRKILTAEQAQQLRSLMRSSRGKRGDRGRRGRGYGPRDGRGHGPRDGSGWGPPPGQGPPGGGPSDEAADLPGDGGPR